MAATDTSPERHTAKASATAFTLRTYENAYNIEAHVRLIGSDLLVAVWGGDKPHIGAVAVAQPRPSLKNPDLTSATASVICLPAHKEDLLVKTASEKLAAALKTQVVVTAGIHWDNLSPEGIAQVMQNSSILINSIIERAGAKWPELRVRSKITSQSSRSDLGQLWPI